ncbi:melatonin receptor type 1A-like [Aplysia californica]|uniref:Melatonin receptor type 1A-like n=1 Tax=Aplysia californica TaxID=6500 RepID=A0ABM0JNF2_APLCA|nr:melatonin receptor type 1A-like [Aplysia californica]
MANFTPPLDQSGDAFEQNMANFVPEYDQSAGTNQDPSDCLAGCFVMEEMREGAQVELFHLIGNLWFRSNLGIATFAILPNILILEIFRCLGISESPTSLSLFALTLSDLTVSLFLFLNTVLSFLTGLENLFGKLTVANLKSQSESMVYIMNRMSSLYTVYLTTMKCCCVALPLQFKQLFTQRNVRKHLILITVACLLTGIPTCLMTYKSLTTSALGNFTHSIIVTGTGSVFREIDVDVVRMGIFVFEPSICQIIVLVDLVIRTAKLKLTSKFRSGSDTGGAESTSSDVKLSGKELRPVKSVMVVAAMFAVCNVPVIILTFVSSLLQYFEQIDQILLDKVYYLSLQVKHSFIACCSCLNVFVYLQYNSSFRQQVVSLAAKLFCRKQKVDSLEKHHKK